MKFYTNVQVHKSKILYRGIEDGHRVHQRLNYKPTLYVRAKKDTGFKTIHGEPLSPINFESIYEAKQFVDSHANVSGFDLYGLRRWEYSFISEMFPDQMEYTPEAVNVALIDIEVASGDGFPEVDTAKEEVVAITFKTRRKFLVFGCGEFNNTRSDVTYIKCSDEKDLLTKFISEWKSDYPDIISGWYIKQFDIPYLCNRIMRLFGEDKLKELSPWNIVQDKETITQSGKTIKSYTLLGVATLDYIDIYMKYARDGKSRDSYKLDNIAYVELKERKLSYTEYDSLHQLYLQDYQKFIEYNIRDVELVERLETKLKLLELIMVLAYDSKTNYEDAFMQVKMWDILIYNFLQKRNIVVPDTKRSYKDEAYVGAYVKEPIIGFHEWVVSFDLLSMYPHLVMGYNISPDTFIDPDIQRPVISPNHISVNSLLDRKVDTSPLKARNIALTPNGQFFSRDKPGFLATMLSEMFEDRDRYKKVAIQAKKDAQGESDPERKRLLENKVARYDILQSVKKVCLNSAYGALGNEYFRFFDTRQAAAITTAGQLVIRWIERAMNEYLNKIMNTTGVDYVIASDTDSLYLNLAPLVNVTISQKPGVTGDEITTFLDKVCKDKLQPIIDSACQDLADYTNAYAQKMKMKREVIAQSGIWTAKKHYILSVWDSEGVRYSKPEVKIMGLEMKKSSTPGFFRPKMERCVDIILSGDQKALLTYIQEVKDEMKSVPVADIAFPRGVNNLEKYAGSDGAIFGKATPIHARGSLIFNYLITGLNLGKKYATIKEGDKIRFIYLKEPNPIHSNVISFVNTIPSEFELASYIDYETQFSKGFLEPIRLITDAIHWSITPQNNLAKFLFS